MHADPANIEAALLYRDRAPIDFGRILHGVNAALACHGIHLTSSGISGRDFAMFTSKSMHVLISLSDTALPVDMFARALGSHYTRIRAADYAARIDTHARSVLIAVGDGASPSRELPDRAPFDRKILTCYRTLTEVIRQARPDLVHWSQSDLLLTAEEAMRSADLPFPMHIVTHPAPFSSGNDEFGNPRVGFRATQSHQFCAKTLVMEECAKPLDFSLTVIDFLMLQFMTGKIGLRHGDVYKFSDAEQLTIQHVEPSDEHPDGYISVRFEKRGGQPRPVKPAATAPRRSAPPPASRQNGPRAGL